MPKRVLEKLKLTEISGVDRPCQEGARVAIMKRAKMKGECTEEEMRARIKKLEERLAQLQDLTKAWGYRRKKKVRKVDSAGATRLRELRAGRLNLSKKFNPGQERDEHGRWTLSGAARNYARAYAEIKGKQGQIINRVLTSEFGQVAVPLVAGVVVDGLERRSLRSKLKFHDRQLRVDAARARAKTSGVPLIRGPNGKNYQVTGLTPKVGLKVKELG